jgi:serine/threonine protein kinase
LDPCDPDRLKLLADDRLPAEESSELERHLERCDRCRDALDELVGADQCLGAVRRYLAPDETEWHGMPAESDVSLSFLAPSDWPDSIGRLGTYEIKGVLGRGGMGVVLKALDPALGRNVAIKVMSPSLASSGAARQRFLREARAAAAVVHEHVVGVFAVVEVAGLPSLVMEYVPGGSLQDRMDRQGRLSVPEVLRIGMQTASGLAAAHAQGLVHRDVKPANILLEESVERVRLTDFGLARAMTDAAMTRSGVVAGTPYYMAPEQAQGATPDLRADLFSLGSTLYAACAGHPPFRADSPLAVLRRVSDDNPRPLCEINPDVPIWLDAAIARLMAKDPARRFQTATEVADLFEQCLAHVQQPTLAPLPAGLDHARARRSGSPGSRRAAIAAAAVIVLGAGVLMLNPFQAKRSHAPAQPAPATDPAGAWQTTRDRTHPVRTDDVERLIDETDEQARALEADLRSPRSADDDWMSAQSRALSREVEALEREILVGRPMPAAVRDSIRNPKSNDRR